MKTQKDNVIKDILLNSYAIYQNLSETGLIKSKYINENFNPNVWIECLDYYSNSIFSLDLHRIPKRIYKWMVRSNLFYFTGNKCSAVYSLTLPKAYTRLNTYDIESSRNGKLEFSWFLLLSEDESNIDRFIDLNLDNSLIIKELYYNSKYISNPKANKIMIIPSYDVDIFLAALHKIRPEFANEIRLYLECL